jgi:hypothetical protein
MSRHFRKFIHNLFISIYDIFNEYTRFVIIPSLITLSLILIPIFIFSSILSKILGQPITSSNIIGMSSFISMIIGCLFFIIYIIFKTIKLAIRIWKDTNYEDTYRRTTQYLQD